MDPRTLKEKVASGFAWESITKLIIQTSSWASTIVVARLLDPADYGIVAISGLFTGILLVLTEMGLTAGLINQKEVTKQQLDSIFWLSIFLSIVFYAALYFLAAPIEHYYRMDGLADIIKIAGLVLPFSSLRVVPAAVAMRQLDFRFRALAEMAGQFINIVVAIALALMHFGAWSLVWSTLLSQIAITLIYLPIIGHVPQKPDIRVIKPVLRFGLTMMASAVLDYINTRAGTYMVSSHLGQRSVGYYSMANTLAQMPMEKIGSIFNRIMFPTVSRIKSDAEEARALFLKLHKYLIAISAPILVGGILVAGDLVHLLFEDKWAPIIPILQLMCVVNLMRISGMILPATLNGLGAVGAVLRYNIASAIIIPSAFLIGVMHAGIIGMIWAWIAVYPLLYLVLFLSVKNRLNFTLMEFIKSIAPCIGATTVMTVSVALFQHSIQIENQIFELLASIVIGFSGYILTYYFFFPLEIKSLVKILRGNREVSV
jgi:O-antigen/teichoic acid export membrane protein